MHIVHKKRSINFVFKLARACMRVCSACTACITNPTRIGIDVLTLLVYSNDSDRSKPPPLYMDLTSRGEPNDAVSR